MLKKILKWTGISLLIIVVLLAVTPFLFKDKIREMVLSSINKNLDATVAVADVDLSLFRQFPMADVRLQTLSVINKAPFAGDTLFFAEELHLKMSVKQLFRSAEEGMEIESFSAKNGKVNILFNEDGVGNYDIALKKDDGGGASEDEPLKFKVQDYGIENFRFAYKDEKSKIRMQIDSLNHNGKGDFSGDILDLDTESSALVSLDMDQMSYLNKVALALDAVLAIDLKQMKFGFKENKAMINKLPLEFDGSLQMLDQGQRYDLTFKTPESGFQNFLALIPSAYSGSLKDVKTTGDFKVSGFAKGDLTDTTVPTFDVSIASNNASFQYPSLPKSVQDIVIDTRIKNETGLANDTYVNLNKLAFRIDQDRFETSANIKNLAENPLVDAKAKGTINLANLSKAYPVKLEKPLSGLLRADIAAHFDMKAVEENAYDRIDGSGSLSLSGFDYTDDTSGKKYQIGTADLAFTKAKINLKQFSAKTGKTDLQLNGTLENLLGFMLKNQTIRGNFNMSSNQFAVSDFMTESEPAKGESKPKEAVKIPAFLDCTLNAKANTVLYDNLTLKNVSGKIILKDEKARLENVKTDVFGGSIAVTGDVSTKEATPTFNLDLGMKTVDIQQTFTQLEMMKSIAPIAGVINGKLNSTIKVNGKLDAREMTPLLNTISGDLFGQLLSTTVNEKTSPLLSKLDESAKFIDLEKLNLNDLKAALTFTNGRVNLKPLTLKYQDIKVDVAGSHGFDQTMGYNLTFDVPAKYLGSEAGNLLAKLSDTEVSKLGNIPVKANIGGDFKNPKIATDLKSSMTVLTSRIVEAQKGKLLNQGSDAIKNILSGTKGSNSGTPATKDTTKTKSDNEKVKGAAKDLLDLFGKKKKETK